MAKIDKTYTGKFQVNQKVRNKTTGYTGYIAEVDPKSFNPPRGTAEHYHYRVVYSRWVSAHWSWEAEGELESA